MKLCPRKVDRKLILYGYGTLGRLAEEVFNELKIPIYLIVDHTNQAAIKKGIKESSLIAVCVASEPYLPIAGQLEKDGWKDVMPVYDIIMAYPEIGITNGWFSGKDTEEDCENIIFVNGNFDFDSQWHYLIFRKWHQYRKEYELDIEPRPSLPSTLADIRARQRVAIWPNQSFRHPAPYMIHAEGCELKTLEENIKIFQSRRPVLEVACYHSRDGLWKIPKYLMDNLKDYRFTFRLHCYMGTGAYLYCTPEEKYENNKDYKTKDRIS